jgi:hypothetical protein
MSGSSAHASPNMAAGASNGGGSPRTQVQIILVDGINQLFYFFFL